MESKYCSAEYQRQVAAFVDREVIYCVSQLVSEIAAKDEDYFHLFCGADEDDEIYEHWIVSSYLADRLEAKGETVERDFYGLTIWGRGTTGQAIALDHVICAIFDETR